MNQIIVPYNIYISSNQISQSFWIQIFYQAIDDTNATHKQFHFVSFYYIRKILPLRNTDLYNAKKAYTKHEQKKKVQNETYYNIIEYHGRNLCKHMYDFCEYFCMMCNALMRTTCVKKRPYMLFYFHILQPPTESF